MRRLVWMMFGLACAASAVAQVARDGGGGGASQAMQMQLQQLASERTALKNENAKLQSELQQVKQDLDAAKAAQDSASRKLRATEAFVARSASERSSSEEQAAKLRANLEELIAKFRETAQTLRTVETERVTLQQTVVTRDQSLKACATSNQSLYQLNDELLTRIEKSSSLAKAEPFTRLKRIQLENLIDDYRARAEDQKMPPPGTGAGPNGGTSP